MNSEPQELIELIQACLDGSATDAQVALLNSRLRADAAARDLYLQMADTHSCLAVDESLWMDSILDSRTIPMPTRAGRERWLSWRPLTAAAAGVLIGVFSATALWAFTSAGSPRAHERELPLADGSFDQNAANPPLYMPRKFGLWAGDPVAVVSDFSGIKPHSGQRMARYMASAMSEELQATSEASDLWQVLPLPGSGERLVRIRAWFNAVGPASFTIGAVAGGEGPESASALWKDRAKEDPKLLAVGMKQVAFSAASPGWQMAELLLQVPDPARVLVIDLAAHRMRGVTANDGFPGQFVDDVSVTIADEPALP